MPISSILSARAWRAWAPAVAFLISSGLVFWLTADIFHPSLDEGIYLQGGHRVAQGQVPYRDFFAYTGPLIYWVLGALELIFGRNLPLLRLSVAAPFGLIAAAIFVIVTSRGAGWRLGAGVAAVHLGMTFWLIGRMDISHRWLSAGLYSAAAALALSAVHEPCRWRGALCGALAGLSAWSTPTFLVPSGLLIVWMALRPERRFLVPFLAGTAAVSAPALWWLWQHGALRPMLDHLLWASDRYRIANSLPYGYIADFGVRWSEGGVRALPRLSLSAWPAMLLPLALLAGIDEVRRKTGSPGGLLLLLTLGFGMTAYPRWDVIQLIYVTPLAYASLALWCSAHLPELPRRLVFASAAALSFFVCVTSVARTLDYVSFPTRAGILRRTMEEADAIERLERRIPEGATVFVYPYMPVMLYVLNVRNPVSFEWMQPGMMSAADELEVLRQLRARPPRFVIQQWLPEEAILAVWPNSDRSRLRYPSIEDFIGSSYVSQEEVTAPNFKLTLMERLAREP